jgi:hypothetical protein
MDVSTTGRCFECRKFCIILYACSKCYDFLITLDGDNHNCPDDDEGFEEPNLLMCYDCYDKRFPILDHEFMCQQ